MKAILSCAEKIAIEKLESMELYEILRYERSLEIIINEKTFFYEPLFPIMEFVLYCLHWMKKRGNFLYNSIEIEDEPLLFIKKENDMWTIYSSWQKFDCNEKFSFEEVLCFINSIIDQVIERGDKGGGSIVLK